MKQILILATLVLGMSVVFGQKSYTSEDCNYFLNLSEHYKKESEKYSEMYFDLQHEKYSWEEKSREWEKAYNKKLKNLKEVTNLTVYPIVATNTIILTYVRTTTVVELSNALGGVVGTTEGTSMDVSGLPAGVYFATLKINGVAIAVQRIQVQ